MGGAWAWSCAKREAQRLGQALVEVARHLADLHQRALHLAEAGGDVGRGAQLPLPVERSAALGAEANTLRAAVEA